MDSFKDAESILGQIFTFLVVMYNCSSVEDDLITDNETIIFIQDLIFLFADFKQLRLSKLKYLFC